jgi:hypothetical protein
MLPSLGFQYHIIQIINPCTSAVFIIRPFSGEMRLPAPPVGSPSCREWTQTAACCIYKAIPKLPVLVELVTISWSVGRCFEIEIKNNNEVHYYFIKIILFM